MKTSFIQIFDALDDAVTALGFVTGAYPDHAHALTKSSNQVQVWSKINGVSDAKAYGEPNAKLMYLVTSLAPE